MKRSRLTAWTLLCASCLPALAGLPTVPPPEPAPAVGALGLLQAGAGMLLVLGLIFVCAWLARRFGLQRLGGSSLLRVISSSAVGARERVVVVEVAGTWLVLGVTPSHVNTLHTLAAQPMPAEFAGAPGGAQEAVALFSSKLREALSGKARAR
jgi:flagellar protein FliO/FliZ